MSASWRLSINSGVPQRLREAARDGLYQAAEHVLEQSKRVVPIEEATLSSSGKASVADTELTAAVSYDTPYAVVQHEDLTFQHDAGRTAKYLEQPMAASRDAVARIIADRIRRETR